MYANQIMTEPFAHRQPHNRQIEFAGRHPVYCDQLFKPFALYKETRIEQK